MGNGWSSAPAARGGTSADGAGAASADDGWRAVPTPARLAMRQLLLAGFPPPALPRSRVILATAHLDHDPGNNGPRNLAALCQRCHLAHDRDQHRRQRWATLFYVRALGDLFDGHYKARF